MNTHIGSRLKAAAQAGNIDLLYTVIQDDPSILDDIDLIPFIETPLHIAASLGHLQFATEIMRLKPSFAWKLNPQGFSPIHLAMNNDQKMMVYRFVNLNKDLVRIQGREGMTPLHFASHIGEVDLLIRFLILCPESIEYLTVRRETALRIAIKNQQYESLQVLVGWFKVNDQRGAKILEKDILNQMDEAGNTILHIAALSSDPQALKLLVKSLFAKKKLLVKTMINLNEKNLDNKTSFDMATTPEMKSILFSIGAKPSSEVIVDPTLAHVVIRIVHKSLIYPRSIRGDITEKERNTWLIVATLIATAMYASILTPPGGVYQISAGDMNNNLNITSSNSTLSKLGFPGSSVLTPSVFYVFSILNILSFILAVIAIFILTPRGNGIVSSLVSWSILLFYISYLNSLLWIIPEDANFGVVLKISGLISVVGWGIIGIVNYDMLNVHQWNCNVMKRSRW